MTESRGGVLIQIDKDKLATQMKMYYDKSVSWDILVQNEHKLTRKRARFEPKKTRGKALREEYNDNRVIEYLARPFDIQLAYYTSVRPVWKEYRPHLWGQRFDGQKFLISHASTSGHLGYPAFFANTIGDCFVLSDHTVFFPVYDHVPSKGALQGSKTANLSKPCRLYLKNFGLPNPDSDESVALLPWLHALAIFYSPKYIAENGDMLKNDFLRLPMPEQLDLLQSSAKRGQDVAAALDLKQPLPSELVADEINSFGVPRDSELGVTAGWGSPGDKVLPGKGRIEKREWTAEESSKLQKIFTSMQIDVKRGFELIGNPMDVYLNKDNCWQGIPKAVWECRIGSHQVIKKWLSYREKKVLGRDISVSEAEHVTEMVKRLTVIILLGDSLDANYETCRDNAYEWPSQEPQQPKS